MAFGLLLLKVVGLLPYIPDVFAGFDAVDLEIEYKARLVLESRHEVAGPFLEAAESLFDEPESCSVKRFDGQSASKLLKIVLITPMLLLRKES